MLPTGEEPWPFDFEMFLSAVGPGDRPKDTLANLNAGESQRGATSKRL